MKARAFFLVVLAILAPCLQAQTSKRERTGAERRFPVELCASLDGALASPADGGAKGVELQGSLSFEALFAGRLSVCLGLPADLLLGASAAPQPWLHVSPGDPSLDLSYSLKLPAWRLEGGGSLTLPSAFLGFASSGSSVNSHGSAAVSCSARIAAIRFLDPLALGISLSAGDLLERRGRYAELRGPASFSLALQAIEVVNDRSSFTLSISQSLQGPRRIDGRPESQGWRYSLGLRLSCFIAMGDTGLRFGLGSLATNSPSFLFGAERRLRIPVEGAGEIALTE